jgi:hypothetical protein
MKTNRSSNRWSKSNAFIEEKKPDESLNGLTKSEIIKMYYTIGIEARYSGKTKMFYLYQR